MENAIFIVTTLLFGKLIYWMHDNRNNLGKAVKDVLQTFGLIVLVIAVIVALIAGVLWLLVEFIRAHPEILLLAFFVMFCYRIEHMSPKEREQFFTELHQQEIERNRQECAEKQREIEDLRREQSYIKKRNTILDDIAGGGLSKSELRQNQRLYDKMDIDIQDKQRELDELQR